MAQFFLFQAFADLRHRHGTLSWLDGSVGRALHLHR